LFSACVRESEDGIAEQTAKLDSLITEPLPDKFVEANTKNKNVPEERNERVNWKSHPQALWALKSAGLDVASTGKKVLAGYEGNPLADALGALRKVGDVATRFRQTKVQNGRAHAKWKQLEAAIGRMACEKPPLQGIPQELKRAFVAPAGHKLIVSDLSQIEVRSLSRPLRRREASPRIHRGPRHSQGRLRERLRRTPRGRHPRAAQAGKSTRLRAALRSGA
jgi:hypothetical protein